MKFCRAINFISKRQASIIMSTIKKKKYHFSQHLGLIEYLLNVRWTKPHSQESCLIYMVACKLTHWWLRTIPCFSYCWEQDSGVTEARAIEWWKWPVNLLNHRQFWEQFVKYFCLLVSKVFIETPNHELASLEWSSAVWEGLQSWQDSCSSSTNCHCLFQAPG